MQFYGAKGAQAIMPTTFTSGDSLEKMGGTV